MYIGYDVAVIVEVTQRFELQPPVSMENRANVQCSFSWRSG